MASKHQLKNKIRVTANIKQITRAMQMVAAAKMRKSEGVAMRARPYAKKALALLRNVLNFSLREELRSPYFGPVELRHGAGKHEGPEKICLVAVTSDRGLCGAYNSGVLRAAMKFIESYKDAEILHVLPIGRKAKEYFAKRNATMPNAFTNFSEITTLYDAEPVFNWLIEQYQAGTYTKIVFCSTTFISALVQKVEFHEVLPLTFPELLKIVRGIVPKTGLHAELARVDEKPEHYYKFEPSYQKIFETLVLALVKVEVLHLIFESNASEHAARMVAMKSATENAENIMKTLQQALNKARQESITQELVEMASAKDAMAV